MQTKANEQYFYLVLFRYLRKWNQQTFFNFEFGRRWKWKCKNIAWEIMARFCFSRLFMTGTYPGKAKKLLRLVSDAKPAVEQWETVSATTINFVICGLLKLAKQMLRCCIIASANLSAHANKRDLKTVERNFSDLLIVPGSRPFKVISRIIDSMTR